MITKHEMLAEDLKIRVGNRNYHNLDHYSPNWVSRGPSIYGAFNSFRSDALEYDESGKPTVAKFGPTIVAGVGAAKRRIKIPISRIREEINELETELWKALEDESNVTVIGEGKYKFRVNKQVDRVRGLIRQRKDFLHIHVDRFSELEKNYAGIY